MAPRPVATASRFRVYAALVALVGGALGGAVGFFVGERLANGFTFDWYVQEGRSFFEVGEVLLPVALLAAGIAFTLVPFGAYVAFRVWDRRVKRARAPAAVEGARTRDGHVVLAMVGFSAALAALVAMASYAALFILDVGLISPLGYRDVMTGAGALAGFLAVYFAVVATGDGLAAGRVVERPGENLIGRIAVGASRYPIPVLLVIAVVTAGAGYGVTMISTNVDVADVLPRGDPNTVAAKNLTEKFKSSFTLQTTIHVRVADEETYRRDAEKHLGDYRVTTANATNISDEVYVRAIGQLVQFVLDQNANGSPFVGTIALSEFYSLINWTIAGGIKAPDSAYSLPPARTPHGAMQYDLVDRGLWTALPDVPDAVISPDFAQTSILFTVEPDEEMSSKEIGEWALRVRDDYVRWAETSDEAYKVFTGDNAPRLSVDLPVANAHSSELAAKDFKRLLPLIAAFILVCLYVAFRNWTSVAVSFTMLAVAVTWTFGAMGAMRIPLNTLNLTTLPLIMGVGIDYGIHMMNEYQEMRAQGRSASEAWSHAGNGSALALFVATLTTTSGLLVMVVSPSLLIAQLGILAAIAIVSCFLLSVMFIPAFTTLLGGGVPAKGARRAEYRPSVVMPKIATFVSRFRVVAVILLLLVGVSAYGSFQSITREPFGDPPRNWLESDPLRQEHEAALQGFYASETDDVKANILIFEGDITDPAAHRYMDAIEESLKARGIGTRIEGEEGRVITDTLRTLPFLVRTYLTVKDGLPGAGGFVAFENLATRDEAFEPYPSSKEELSALMDEVHTTPLAGLANLFYDHPHDQMAMMLFSVRAATYEDAETVWFQVQDVIDENDHLRPPGMNRPAFFGNTAINYLFVAKEVPWLGYMSIATVCLVFVIVLGATRSLKLASVVATANFLTSLLWVGVLPQVGIGLAITLTLPLIFIFAMGSDYALHLSMRCQRSKDTYDTMATVGKGVLFSFVTTLGAFAIFTQISNLSVRKTMVGTTIAIGVVMLTTLLLVPIFYPVRRKRAEGNPPEGGGQESVSVPIQGGSARPKRMIVEMPPPPARSGSTDP